jgi:hypothetical protein
MPKSVAFMPSPREFHGPFNSENTVKPKVAYPASLGREAFSIHIGLSGIGEDSPNHLLETQKPEDETDNVAQLVKLANFSDMQLGVDAGADYNGLWAVVHSVQTRQEEVAQTLGAVILQLQDQVRVMKSEIARMQLAQAANGSTARTARTHENSHHVPSEGEVLQQKQSKQQVHPLKQDIIDIASDVCDMFAGPLNALTESVQRAESDMENLRSALLDVHENQEKYNHGADEIQAAIRKLDKMVFQVLDVMKCEESHSSQIAAVSARRSEPKSENDPLLGSLCGTPLVPRLSHPVFNAQKTFPAMVFESPRTCGLSAGGNCGEEKRSKTNIIPGTNETPELWKRIYARSHAATQGDAK